MIDISSNPGIEESDICRVVLTPLVPKEEMAYTVSELMTSRHYSRTGPCQMEMIPFEVTPEIVIPRSRRLWLMEDQH